MQTAQELLELAPHCVPVPHKFARAPEALRLRGVHRLQRACEDSWRGQSRFHAPLREGADVRRYLPRACESDGTRF